MSQRYVEDTIGEVRMLANMMGLAAEEIVTRDSELGNTLAMLASRIRVCTQELEGFVTVVPAGPGGFARTALRNAAE